MSVISDLLKSQIRREMSRRTEEILKAVRRVEKSQNELTHAIDRWIKFMEKTIEELRE
jgi:hypothetical protein